MKIKVNKACIILSYIFVFISAFTYLRFTVTQIYRWRLLYLSSMMGIIILSYIYIFAYASKKFFTINCITVLLIFIVVYELIISAFSGLFVAPMILIDVISWPLVFVVFYDYCKKYELPKCFSWLTLVGSIIVCILSIPNIMTTSVQVRGSSIFAAYYSFAFLPMVYLLRSKRESLLLSVVVTVLMILSTKRSAFIIVIVGISAYYILSNHVQNKSIKQMQKYIGLMIVFIAVAILCQMMIERLGLDIIARLTNISEDGGSGRSRIWRQVMSYFQDSSVLEKIFGHGFHAVFYEIKPLGIARYAHNSLIETLYDYGILGLILILVLIWKIISKTVNMVKTKSTLAPAMSFTVFSLIVLTLVSYFFEQSLIIVPFSIAWGVCLGKYEREIKEIRRNNG